VNGDERFRADKQRETCFSGLEILFIPVYPCLSPVYYFSPSKNPGAVDLELFLELPE